MIQIVNYIIENWKIIGLIMLGLTVFALTGSIVKLLKSAKEGLKESFNPLGFLVFIALVILIYFLYIKLGEL